MKSILAGRGIAAAWAAVWGRAGLVLLVLLLLAFPWFVPVLYVQHLAILVLMYIALASSWNIIGGYTGYESFGHIVFFGAGAYSSALLLVRLGWSPFLTAPLSGLVACLVAVIALPSLRTRGAYFAIMTLAMALVGQLIIYNADAITGGGQGLFLPLYPWEPEVAKRYFYYAMLLGAAGAVGLNYLLKHSKAGLGLELIREDEEKAEAVGINTTTYKTMAFLLSAYFPGFVGAVHGYYINFLSPAGAFNIVISINILLFAFFGGKGTISGPVIGALALIPISQFLNIILASELHALLFGVLLITIVLFLPKGLVSLADRKPRSGVHEAEQKGLPNLTSGTHLLEERQPRHQERESSGEVLLSCNDISKHFGGVAALDRLTFEVCGRTITGLIGPNGSGKSTAINVITGYYHADAGQLGFRGKVYNGMKPHQVKELGIARSFQETRVFGNLTVLENVVASVSGRAGIELLHPRISTTETKRAMELLDFVGLAEKRDALASQLSYGQQKLLEFASVIMGDPDLILLDEPAAGVNPILVERIMDLVQYLYRQGKTFLIIEHDMGVIMRYCNPIIVMESGHALMTGSPDMVQADPRVLEAYLGE